MYKRYNWPPDISAARLWLTTAMQQHGVNDYIRLSLLAEAVVETICEMHLDAEAGAEEFAAIITKMCEARALLAEAKERVCGIGEEQVYGKGAAG
jgi:hypothetical protein